MPIEFRQPSPVSGSTSIGAGQADVIMKTLPTLASLVESTARLASQAYGHAGSGGGGGYGVVHTGGPVQVLPTSDYGAEIQVQQQANREQRAADLGFAEREQDQRLAYSLDPDHDPVARHIKMQEDYADRRQLQAQQANEINKRRAMQALLGNGADPNSGSAGAAQGPGPTWEVQDEQDLVKQRQIIRQAAQDQEDGKLKDPNALEAIQSPAMAKINELQARKKAATEYAQMDAERQQMRAMEIMTGQQDRLALETRKVFKQNGMDGVVDKFDPKTGEYLGSLQWNPKTQTMEPIKDLGGKGKATAEKAPKEEKPLTDTQINQQAKALAEREVTLTGDAAKDKVAIHEATKKFAGQIVEQQRAASEAKAAAQRAKDANPVVVKALEAHAASIPRRPDGAPDLANASIQQLERLDAYYAHPKEIGANPAVASAMRKAIHQAIMQKGQPATAEAEHPAPAEAAAFEDKGTTNQFVNRISKNQGEFNAKVGNVISQLPEKLQEKIPEHIRFLHDPNAQIEALLNLDDRRVSAARAIKEGLLRIDDARVRAAKMAPAVANEMLRKAATVPVHTLNAYQNFKRWLAGEQ